MKVAAAAGVVLIVVVVLVDAGCGFQKSQFPSLPGGATWGRQTPTKVSLTTNEADGSELHQKWTHFYLFSVIR